MTSVFGLEMEEPQSWVRVKTTAEMKRHQNRDMLSFLTRMSEPIPKDGMVSHSQGPISGDATYRWKDVRESFQTRGSRRA